MLHIQHFETLHSASLACRTGTNFVNYVHTVPF